MLGSTRSSRTTRPSALTRILVRVVVALSVSVVVGGWGGFLPSAASASTGTAHGAQPRHVLVVSDSILLGAQAPVTSLFVRAGWTVGFDGAVSRSTAAGADVVRARAAELTDALVVSLGANDAGSAATFRRRVEAVMAAAGAVPAVYWLTIREVRPYYAPANQVLRDAAARHPNLHLIDWNAWTSGRLDLTAGDGLHLTPSGAGLMGMVVAGAVTASAAEVVPSAVTTVAPPAEVPTIPPAPAPPADAPAIAPGPTRPTGPEESATGEAPSGEVPVVGPTVDRSLFVAPMPGGIERPVAASSGARTAIDSREPGPWSWVPLVAVVAGSLVVIHRRRS